jgi:arginyl-tRNA synthetase
MNVLATLRQRFRTVLQSMVEDPDPLLEMVRPTQDTRFGDYQANCAMPLGKRLKKSPREVAEQIVAGLQIDDLCEAPEIAGPGFINLSLKQDWLIRQLRSITTDVRLGIDRTDRPQTFVVDFSSPNVAKPMHVGHIRSTVIGDAICRTLRFVGHQAVSDNHLGDWGTQFGMIIYGFRHFVDQQAYEQHPVQELARIYKLVHQLVEYREVQHQLPGVDRQIDQRQSQVEQAEAELAAADQRDKKAAKVVRKLRTQLDEERARRAAMVAKLEQVDNDPALAEFAQQHANIDQAVLEETAKLHANDPDNLKLWHEFLPKCQQDIDQIYRRIDVEFDQQLGESFYHDRLAAVVESFCQKGLATQSEGAQCVFLPDFDAPMIIQKKDGAYLYATTDLATIQYRIETWNPDAILYVVDHRQREHFEKLFAAVKLWGYSDVDLRHISFGTVMGEDGRPYRTRSGDVVGLEGLLDEAIRRAHEVVSANDDSKPNGPELSEQQRSEIARVVGHAALKYADLSHNRTSDYVFSYDKMVALEGNTATYMQYSYARVRSIFVRGDVDVDRLRTTEITPLLGEPIERELALELIRFGDALDEMLEDFRPNVLTAYLFSLATRFSKFYQQCDVLRAEPDALRNSRLLLCDLTGRTIRQGLELLGIGVVEKM